VAWGPSVGGARWGNLPASPVGWSDPLTDWDLPSLLNLLSPSLLSPPSPLSLLSPSLLNLLSPPSLLSLLSPSLLNLLNLPSLVSPPVRG
jgi:hypothetical protein